MKVMGVEMQDMGKKPEEGIDMPVTSESKKNEPIYPSFSLQGDNEYLEGKEVGDECIMVAKVKVTGKNSDESENFPHSMRTSFKILEAGFKEHGDKKNAGEMSDEELNAGISNAYKGAKDADDEDEERMEEAENEYRKKSTTQGE